MTQLTFELPFRPALGLEDFLVADSNASAVELVDRWPDWSHHALWICGPEGSGKTHLARVWQGMTNAQALSHQQLNGFQPARGEEGLHWLLEDLDNSIDETALLHLFNWSKETGGSLLLTSRSTPAELEFDLPDLSSRLSTIPVARLEDPDDRLLSAVLVKQFTDRQLRVDEPVIRYLVPRMERSFRAARRIVSEMDRQALAEQRRITIPFVRKVKADLSDD